MIFPDTYKALKQNIFINERCSIKPIRWEHRHLIMKWRNEQMYHLRQNKELTNKDQDKYFTEVVQPLFNEEKPKQILFSYFQDDLFIGYGGLVHINWHDSNAEISFLLNTNIKNEEFSYHWSKYLNLIEELAFNELNLQKIYTYAFDIRPYLYPILENENFTREATLKNHCFIDNTFKDVVIHSKLNINISLRLITNLDVETIFNWANDPLTRKNSFNSNEITFSEHKVWFENKLKDKNSTFFICKVNNTDAGLIRFEKKGNETVIGILIDKNFRGKKLSHLFLTKSCQEYLKTNSQIIHAYIKQDNNSSVKAFEKANFTFKKELVINNEPAYLYIYEKK